MSWQLGYPERFFQKTGEQGGAFVLCYHRIAHAPSFSPSVSKEHFRKQLKYLKAHFHVVPLRDLVEFLKDSSPQPKPYWAITFDDGFRDVGTHALPELKELQLPATCFVSTAFLDGEVPWTEAVAFLFARTPQNKLQCRVGETVRIWPLQTSREREKAAREWKEVLKKVDNEKREELFKELQKSLKVRLPKLQLMLSWEDCLQLHRSGVEIGSHTVSHPMLARCCSQRVEYEVEESKRVLEEKLRTPVLGFSYPGDSFSPSVREAVERAGYAYACRVGNRVNFSLDPYSIFRVHIRDGSLPHFAAELSLFFERFRPFSLYARRR